MWADAGQNGMGARGQASLRGRGSEGQNTWRARVVSRARGIFRLTLGNPPCQLRVAGCPKTYCFSNNFSSWCAFAACSVAMTAVAGAPV